MREFTSADVTLLDDIIDANRCVYPLDVSPEVLQQLRDAVQARVTAREHALHAVQVMASEYRVVNSFNAPAVLKGGQMTTTNRAFAEHCAQRWDEWCPTHAPHRVEVVA